MEKWKSASNYMGEEYPEYYVLISQNRDSPPIDRANFDEALERLGGESETVKVIRSGHWAVGWVEVILIHESDKEHIGIGEKIQSELQDYPVLSEDRFSQYELDKVMGYWKSCGLRERIRLCQDCKIPFTAARFDDAPSRYNELWECLRE
jgi:hypothetical protein